ncbi:putative disease resistance protein RGA3 [Cryptomeria japonica]|uniref:putative disease resistance protein RGA3 n=1 Tax=Cryptomeria japonica TaxID=3369 RepID=UPI0027DA99BD|nr:putative disease resistance protein RGA3 [Cryptomeria japonica]
MAFLGEAAAGKICEMAVEMAVQKLTEEAKLLLDFSKDFLWLQDKLIYVRSFLRDADQQSPHKEGVKQWLDRIRVVSLLAEDICEECAVESIYGNDPQSCGFSCNQWIFRHRIGRKIKDIKERIRSIIEDRNELKLLGEVVSANEASSSTSHRVDHKKSYLLPSGSYSHAVGIQSKVDDMLRLLDNNASPIIAVVGMGGIGKSYLLQHVFNYVKERYDKSIWLSFSQSYSISTLQCDIASYLGLGPQIKNEGVSQERAAELIHENLKGKRYLVVLDDVWEAREGLLCKLGLLTGDNGHCKVFLSTRNREVCTILNAHIYEMQFLSDSESWNLFRFYAFKGNEAPNHQLEEVGRDILKQCGNLPLAIKMVAAALPKTRMPRDWESKLHRLKEVVIADDDQIIPILRLSYFSLPARLKACFAYLSFFPKVEQINCEYLVYLWIGEGFIPAGEGQWEAAWYCIKQLANLCLLQVWEQYEDRPSCKLTNYCTTHDLLHDLAINISKENKCIFSVEEASKGENGDCCRILLGMKDVNDAPISERPIVLLRTLSLYQNWRIKSIPQNLFTAMRGLRVLDLSGTSISKLPQSLGKMTLLKVLNLNNTEIEKVPKCVRHLKSLLFLALPQRCEKLPVWINEVKCLQHLE